MSDKLIGSEKNILFYNDEEGNINIEVLLENEDVWLNTEALAALFNIDRTGITRHINNIYSDEELEENSTCAKIAHVGNDGKQTYSTNDWKREVENALKVFHYEVLEGKGKVSHEQAKDKALGEYEKYKVIQDKNYVSDFDKLLGETKQIENR